MVNFGILKESPDGKTLENTLRVASQSDESLSIENILILIKYVIPVYPSLSSSSRELLYTLISSSYTFFAQLINFGNSLKQQEKEVVIYRTLAKDILQFKPELLSNYIHETAAKKFERRNVKAMFFGSRLFNFFAREIDIVEYLTLLKIGWEHIVRQINGGDISIPYDVLAEDLVASLGLHHIYSVDILFSDIFLKDEQNFNIFIGILSKATPLEKQKLVENYVIPFFESKISMDNYNSVYACVRLLVNEQMHVNIATIIKLKSGILQEVLLRLLPNSTISKYTKLLVGKFGEIDNINDNTICRILVIILKYRLTENQRNDISHSPEFLEAVTKRLSHRDNEFRDRTMYIAKLISNNELKYDSDFVIKIADLDFSSLNIDFKGITQYLATSQTDNVSTIKNQMQVLSFHDEDSDDEDDENTYSTKHILFLKDLVLALETHQKDSNGNVVALLMQTVKLVRQKKDFQVEVNYYCTQIMTSIVSLNNNFDEQNFEQWRINALVSLVVVVPEKISDLLKLLFTSELSLQQRMSILTSVGLAARELRGYDDKTILKPKSDFPTKRLPWDKPQADAIIELEDHSDINEGIVTWKSSKLTKKKTPEQTNNFRRYSNLFFYPLSHGWLNGIDLGTYDELFKSHYLTTLRIIYECCAPVHNYDSMTQLMEQVMTDAMQQGIPLNPNT